MKRGSRRKASWPLGEIERIFPDGSSSSRVSVAPVLVEKRRTGRAVPGGAVDDGLAVRCETPGPDHAAPERKLLPLGGWRRAALAEKRAEEGAGRKRRGGDGRKHEAAVASAPRGRRGYGRSAARLRETVSQSREVPRQIVSRTVALLAVLGETTLHDPMKERRRRRRPGVERLRLLPDDRRERLRRRCS